jgi:subtilisin family serine protease
MRGSIVPRLRARGRVSLPALLSAVVVASLAYPAAADALVFPNDPYLTSQWGLYNTGQTILGTTGVVGVDAHLPEAWTVTTGSRSVKVAVIDTGIDYNLPDLAPNVDVADGANWVDPGSPPMDTIGHGTAMASIIGAVGDNHVGISGIDWQVSLIPEKVALAEQGMAVTNPPNTGVEVVDAINDAVAKGARVVNLSLGSTTPDPEIDRAIAAAPGTLFVTSAGNQGVDESATPNYPCLTSPGDPVPPNKLCVAAVDETGALASFSTYSATSVDLAAPGQDIARMDAPGSTLDEQSNGMGYGYGMGTSDAAAFVSGVAALLATADPTLDGAGLRARILGSVLRLRGLSGKVASGGMVDAGAALGVAPGPRPRRDPHDALLGRSAKPFVHAPPTGRCLAGSRIVLRIHGADNALVETVAISVDGSRARTIYPPQNERPIALALPHRGRITLTITIDDTESRPYYLTLRYRHC